MIRSLRLALHALIIASLFVACGPSAREPESPTFGPARAGDDRVLIVADIHLDPFDRKELVDELAAAPIERWERIFSRAPNALSSYGHDANASLYLSGLRAMREAIPRPSYLLLAGDLLAHDFHRRFIWSATRNDAFSYRRFVEKTSDFVRYELAKSFPQTRIFPTIGNNDGYCGDYRSTPHDAFLAHQAAGWAPLIGPRGQWPQVTATFARGGYYSAETASGLRILSLNTVFLAKLYENRCGDSAERPAEEELRWLHRELEQLPQGRPTLLLTHIPLGIDGFKTFFHLGFPVPLLKPAYQALLRKEIDAPGHGVATVITGHLHDVGYRQTDEGRKDDKPIVVVPSISPVFGNAPAFTIASISKRGVIDDMSVHRLETRSLRAPTWANVVDFNARYHLNGVTAQSIERLHLRTGADRCLRAVVERDSVGDAPALAIVTLDRKAMWCTNGALTPEAFLRCDGAKY